MSTDPNQPDEFPPLEYPKAGDHDDLALSPQAEARLGDALDKMRSEQENGPQKVREVSSADAHAKMGAGVPGREELILRDIQRIVEEIKTLVNALPQALAQAMGNR